MYMRILAAPVLSLALAVAWLISPPLAQSPSPVTKGAEGIKRTPLQKFDVAGTALETIIGTAEIQPDVSIGRHSHFGVEAGYVLEGEAILLLDGQAPKTVKVGDSYVIPAGVVHDAKAGPKGAKVLATYVVEKGKAFATPAK
jgi:quercetin dioxygenase-like cupin family protein